MAFSIVETTVVNPARKRGGKGNPVAKTKTRRKLTAKQIRYFGSKAQKSALRRKRSDAARPKKHRAHKSVAHHPKGGRSLKRSNPGEIISFVLGNPARRKGTKSMARSQKKQKNTGSHAHRAQPKHMVTTASRPRKARCNPAGLGRPMDWVKGGAGVLGGVLVSRALPQAVASTYNTGITGYFLNMGTALLAGWGIHTFMHDAVLTASVVAGGFAATIARVISDQTSFGQYLSLSGFGDYQFSNFVAPQRLLAWQNAQVQVPQGWNGTALPAMTTSLYGPSTDMGRRGGNC